MEGFLAWSLASHRRTQVVKGRPLQMMELEPWVLRRCVELQRHVTCLKREFLCTDASLAFQKVYDTDKKMLPQRCVESHSQHWHSDGWGTSTLKVMATYCAAVSCTRYNGSPYRVSVVLKVSTH